MIELKTGSIFQGCFSRRLALFLDNETLAACFSWCRDFSFRNEAHTRMELLCSCDETPLPSLFLEVLRSSHQLNNVSLVLFGSSW